MEINGHNNYWHLRFTHSPQVRRSIEFLVPSFVWKKYLIIKIKINNKLQWTKMIVHSNAMSIMQRTVFNIVFPHSFSRAHKTRIHKRAHIVCNAIKLVLVFLLLLFFHSISPFCTGAFAIRRMHNGRSYLVCVHVHCSRGCSHSAIIYCGQPFERATT